MLSYQHIYHAGCRADIHKHAFLAAALAHMVKKDKALTYMETHAARGLYNLVSQEAEKTGEAKDGILSASEKNISECTPDYAAILKLIKNEFGETFYPGSPAIAQKLLRPYDFIHLMELHPQEYAALVENISGKNVKTYKADGYKTVLSSLCPPSPRRGFILIDPSFEVKREYDEVAKFIPELISVWPEATIMLWYPILSEGYHTAMTDKLKEITGVTMFHDEIGFDTDKGMTGSGLLFINPPLGVKFPNSTNLFSGFGSS